jgi:hypothetical protein
MPGDTVLFATENVPQIHKSDNAEISGIDEVLQLSGCTIPAYVYCVPRFACHTGLMGGMPGDIAVFDTANGTETTQSKCSDIKDVAGALHLYASSSLYI